jgi:uncharacterized protein YdeI (YjbR/CyaY-like superfamily)
MKKPAPNKARPKSTVGGRDPRFDAYIAEANEFARPILTHLREVVHSACPEVEEDLKWSHPSFLLEGKILCGMAAFKAHCIFGFWHQGMTDVIKSSGSSTAQVLLDPGRITKVDELPERKTLERYVKAAVELQRSNQPARPMAPKKKKEALVVPGDLAAALKKNKKAAAVFEDASYSFKKEYVEWLTEAKREETRAKRLTTAVEWIAEGKARNWKYQ